MAEPGRAGGKAWLAWLVPEGRELDAEHLAPTLQAISLTFLAALSAAAVLGGILTPERASPWGPGLIVAAGAMTLGCLVLVRLGRLVAASVLLVGMVWSAVTAGMLIAGGIDSPAFSFYTVGVVAAGLLLGSRAAIATCILCGVSSAILGILDARGVLPEPVIVYTSGSQWWIGMVLLASLAGLVAISVARLRAAVADAEGSRALIAERNRELEETLKARDAAREGEALLDVAMGQAGEGIVVLDPDGHVVYSNPALWKVIPREFREHVAGGSVFDAIGEDLRRRVLELVREGGAFRGRLPPLPGFLEHPVVDVSFAPVSAEDGEVSAYLGVVRDVSREVELEAHLRQSQRLEAMGRLAGGVAHDFNNLLVVIQGYAELLGSRAGGDAELLDFAEQITEASRQAAKLTAQLLAFGRRQAQQARVVDLNELVPEAQAMMRRLLPPDVEIVTSLAPQLGRVFVDPGHIHQILMNLVMNARDAMPEGGRITIRTADLPPRETGAGHEVLLAVQDTGEGMDPETAERVFEPFFTTKPEGGTGLGLATVYGIVEQAGGTIRVDSHPGGGSTFSIRLPRTGRSALAPEANVGRSRRLPAGARILVVDDQDAARAFLARLLREEGCEVLEACDGQDALERLEGPVAIDLLLTDVMMPRLDGPGLVARLRERRPDLPVVYTSGFSPDRILEQANTDPNAAFLAKPFGKEALLERVANLLLGD